MASAEEIDEKSYEMNLTFGELLHYHAYHYYYITIITLINDDELQRKT